MATATPIDGSPVSDEVGFAVDEHEHQALDLLDETPRDELDSDDLELSEAIATAERMFARLVAIAATRLLTAAIQLAASDDRGPLDPEVLARVLDRLAERPGLALAIPGAVESVGVSLGLEREGSAWAILLAVAEAAVDAADPDTHACAAALADRLAAAQPGLASGGPEPSRSLRVFRSAAVTAAGPRTRARILAADHPEQLELAQALVARVHDPAALVEQFDAARAALAAAAGEGKPGAGSGPGAPGVGAIEAMTDGPKRKFTVVHLVLALIVLALTVWHYGFR